LAPAGAEPADLEKAKMTLAPELHWLIREGYVIEFNDGSLDLPRTKPPVAPATEHPAVAEAKSVETNTVSPPEDAVASPEAQVNSGEERPTQASETPASEVTSAAPPIEATNSEIVPEPHIEPPGSEEQRPAVSPSPDELVAREQV
jgi:hypothetical protein